VGGYAGGGTGTNGGDGGEHGGGREPAADPAGLDALAWPAAEGGWWSDEWLDLRPALPGLLAALTEREGYVIRGRFGLGGPPRTLRAIGGDLGLTREMVRQVEVRALDRMRAAAVELFGAEVAG
jgi:hypothetical protein